MILQSWVIRWNYYCKNTFFNGSRIDFLSKDDIAFENELMPSGVVIKEWLSQTNFQRDKMEPTLPLIDGEGTYQLLYDIDQINQGSCLFKLIFYDRFEEEVGQTIIWDSGTIFKCPMPTYSYRLQLINGGMTRFHFHSIVIREISDETDGETEKTK